MLNIERPQATSELVNIFSEYEKLESSPWELERLERDFEEIESRVSGGEVLNKRLAKKSFDTLVSKGYVYFALRLSRAAGIGAEIDPKVAQAGFKILLQHGLVDDIAKLREVSGVEPSFDKDEIDAAFDYKLDPNHNPGSIAELEELVGVKAQKKDLSGDFMKERILEGCYTAIWWAYSHGEKKGERYLKDLEAMLNYTNVELEPEKVKKYYNDIKEGDEPKWAAKVIKKIEKITGIKEKAL
ncbi:hypothetical protein KKE33_01090 [Patescibacteria group bacterium]|nr:hypothetical protein [Patescibacteria group bacterium]